MFTIEIERFERQYESTGKMIQESPTCFVQTYRRKGASIAECDYRQGGKMGGMITLVPVHWQDYKNN